MIDSCSTILRFICFLFLKLQCRARGCVCSLPIDVHVHEQDGSNISLTVKLTIESTLRLNSMFWISQETTDSSS